MRYSFIGLTSLVNKPHADGDQLKPFFVRTSSWSHIQNGTWEYHYKKNTLLVQHPSCTTQKKPDSLYFWLIPSQVGNRMTIEMTPIDPTSQSINLYRSTATNCFAIFLVSKGQTVISRGRRGYQWLGPMSYAEADCTNGRLLWGQLGAIQLWPRNFCVNLENSPKK